MLYIVEPGRGWYCGSGDSFEQGEGKYGPNYYEGRLERYTSQYARVVMLGDSMGASAALMFSHLASVVLAFTPQVNLEVGCW